MYPDTYKEGDTMENVTTTKKPTLWTPMYIRLGAASILLSLVEQMLTVNMSLYMEDLGATATIIGVVATVFSVASMIVRFLAGPAMDRYGRKKVGVFGLCLSLIPLIGYMLFPIIGVIAIMRFIQGAGFSCASLSQGTMSVDIPAPERKDEGTGYYGLFYSIATMFGPAAGLAVSAAYGYHNLFLFCTVIFLAEIALSFTLNYEKKRHIVYTSKKSTGEKQSLLDRLIERKALPASFVGFFTSAAYVIVTAFMAVYVRSLGMSGTGAFFTVVAVFTFLGRLVSGRMIAQKKRVLVLMIGNVMMAIGMIFLAVMTTTWQMMLGGVIFGVGGGYAWPALAILAVTDAEPNRRGTANSTYYAGYDLGLAVGGLFGGILADAAGYRAVCMATMAVFLLATALTVLAFKDQFLEEMGRKLHK